MQESSREGRKKSMIWLPGRQTNVSTTCTAGCPVKQYYYNVSFNQHCSQQWDCAELQLCRSVASWSTHWPLKHTDTYSLNSGCLRSTAQVILVQQQWTAAIFVFYHHFLYIIHIIYIYTVYKQQPCSCEMNHKPKDLIQSK